MKRLSLYLAVAMMIFISPLAFSMSCDALLSPTEPSELTLEKFRQMALFGGGYGYFGNGIRHSETYFKTPDFIPLLPVIDEVYLQIAHALRWSPEQTLTFADFPGGRRIAESAGNDVIKPMLSSGLLAPEEFKLRLEKVLSPQMQMEGQLLFVDDRSNGDSGLLEALATWRQLYQLDDSSLEIKYDAELLRFIQEWHRYFLGTRGKSWQVDVAEIKEQMHPSFPLINQVFHVYRRVQETFATSNAVSSQARSYRVEFKNKTISFSKSEE